MCILFSILRVVLTVCFNKLFNDTEPVSCLISVATIFKLSPNNILIFIHSNTFSANSSVIYTLNAGKKSNRSNNYCSARFFQTDLKE